MPWVEWPLPLQQLDYYLNFGNFGPREFIRNDKRLYYPITGLHPHAKKCKLVDVYEGTPDNKGKLFDSFTIAILASALMVSVIAISKDNDENDDDSRTH